MSRGSGEEKSLLCSRNRRKPPWLERRNREEAQAGSHGHPGQIGKGLTNQDKEFGFYFQCNWIQ